MSTATLMRESTETLNRTYRRPGEDTPPAVFTLPAWCGVGIVLLFGVYDMTTRPLIGLCRRDLVARIVAGDTLAIAEGAARNASRERKGKAPVKAYDATPAPTPAPAPALASDAVDIESIVRAAVSAALAGRGITPTPAPAQEGCIAPNPDAEVWHATLADCGGSRWAAYARLADSGWKYRRIAQAAGVTPGSVGNAVSKHRRGIAPDLSFAGK